MRVLIFRAFCVLTQGPKPCPVPPSVVLTQGPKPCPVPLSVVLMQGPKPCPVPLSVVLMQGPKPCPVPPSVGDICCVLQQFAVISRTILAGPTLCQTAASLQVPRCSQSKKLRSINISLVVHICFFTDT